MIYRLASPARVAPAILALFLSLGFFAACGEPAESTRIVSEAHALEVCEEASGCDATDDGAAARDAAANDAATNDAATNDAADDTADRDAAAHQDAATPEDDGGWVGRCETDAECSIGQCVCGVCSESCNGEADACSGLPAGAACFAGRTLPRAALCHATTVPGICLLPCTSDDECGAGLVCALGACLPEPEASAP